MESPITGKPDFKEKNQREKQTYYRVAFFNNCNLLQIADNKANIIITINSLIISSSVALLGYGSASNLLEMNSFLTIAPLLLFLGILLTSTLLAVRAAKPSIVGNRANDEGKLRSNLLFFGESAKYTLEEYLEETQNVLKKKELIVDQMSTTLYYQGKVLNKKYQLIRRAYEVFGLGLGVGILIFIGYMIF
jgi:hypothetical protein